MTEDAPAPDAQTQEPDYRSLLLSLCGSLTLCDHMGDVWGDVETVLRRAGIDMDHDYVVEAEDIARLGRYLGWRYGVRTLYDTPLYDEDDEDVIDEY